jgi:DNA-binding CsgD family transcriptional regulator
LESGVLKVSCRTLRTASPDETLRLHALCLPAATGRGSGSVRIANGRGGHCVVRALPAGVRADNPYDPNHSGCALLFVVSPEPRRVPDADQIRLALDCSRAEAEVAAMLVSGFSPERVARERLVSLTTVRTQIRALFAVCGVSRLSQLVRLLSALV